MHERELSMIVYNVPQTLCCLCTADTDECANMTDNCDDERGNCTNTEGSYECSCRVGYSGDGTEGNCEGID